MNTTRPNLYVDVGDRVAVSLPVASTGDRPLVTLIGTIKALTSDAVVLDATDETDVRIIPVTAIAVIERRPARHVTAADVLADVTRHPAL